MWLDRSPEPLFKSEPSAPSHCTEPSRQRRRFIYVFRRPAESRGISHKERRLG